MTTTTETKINLMIWIILLFFMCVLFVIATPNTQMCWIIAFTDMFMVLVVMPIIFIINHFRKKNKRLNNCHGNCSENCHGNCLEKK